MKIIKPPRLKSGDKVGIISPSNSVLSRKKALHKAVEVIEKRFKLQARIAPHALGEYWYSSGTIKERMADFEQMVNDPEIKMIIFSVGGNTAIELVDHINYDMIKANPKIITGISDATTLLTAITAKTGLITFLGLELTDFGLKPMNYESEWIVKLLFDGYSGALQNNTLWHDFDGIDTTYPGSWQTIRKGMASGKLMGGNYDSFFQLLHTPYQLDFDNAILFMETYKFKKRAIHQALVQLSLHGIMQKIAGLIIGYCLESDNPTEVGNKRPMNDLVLEATRRYRCPIMWIGEIGHNVENILQPIGGTVTLNSTKKSLVLEEPVVE